MPTMSAPDTGNLDRELSPESPVFRAEERLLSPEDLAAYLAVPLATVYRWRYRGEGPTGYRVGRHVRYKLEDVEAWLEGRRDRDAITAS